MLPGIARPVVEDPRDVGGSAVSARTAAAAARNPGSCRTRGSKPPTSLEQLCVAPPAGVRTYHRTERVDRRPVGLEGRARSCAPSGVSLSEVGIGDVDLVFRETPRATCSSASAVQGPSSWSRNATSSPRQSASASFDAVDMPEFPVEQPGTDPRVPGREALDGAARVGAGGAIVGDAELPIGGTAGCAPTRQPPSG